ncbi:acetyl-CoA carboxylase biotin carboxylase subunit [Halalkalibacter alkalisediminis]|uniref:biotin carboxylase n=1 Tax=Halalkalibacter alkalisediminis TaxID=935616 RepID=A0ABV6NM36_9BACI|nr:acetyl-CoA carboxylase biotin carboxylase subunit [Halalkalibacter alkalisediminis]
MFKRILIANRGEIAVRVIRTCKSLGIETVVVYSEADQDALHVKKADHAFLIGPPKVSESYLNIDKIIEVAKESQAEAIHPGYGLLSENPEFARRCAEEKIIFIGPSVELIELMGKKVAARKAMKNAGFPIVPGTDSPVADVEEAIVAAGAIGYPVMLKASSGGGGIGMQLVENDEQLIKAFASNQKRAQMFFGNDEMFLEKSIDEARHIEVQILADQYGRVLHLWERDCSVQRRNQKVIEESPSPFIDEALRNELGKLAVTAARALGYTNAGTIECLVDQEKQIFFLEMNTRLQVEHPVTEEVTGLDLVEWQIRVAAGEKLQFGQEEIKRDGHAIEARIYAEDPKTFYPSPGTITKLRKPYASHIRHEYGVEEGSVVTPFYDPMIAKLIVKGTTRLEAIGRMQEALADYQIEGIKTNIPMLQEIFRHSSFKLGEVTTGFVGEHYKKG